MNDASTSSISPPPSNRPALPRREFLRAATGTAAAASLLGAAAPPSRAEGPSGSSRPERSPLMSTSHASIARARDAALAILKPAQAELERGLALHQESVVFDAYGFAPRAAVDGDALKTLDGAKASDAEMQDAREEMGMIRAATIAAEREEFAEAMACSGVTAIFQNAGEESQDPLVLLKRLARFNYLTDMLRGTLVRATRPDDIVAAKKEGRHVLYLTGNGIPLPQQWATAEEELGAIRLFYQLGIRMMHMTYNRRNMLGDGCAELANGGLSDLGRMAVAEMNRVGVIVDVAHSGWRTSLEAAKASKKPMVASHTVCQGLNDHIRAKPDDVIRAICDTGGLIGICCIPPFLARTGDIAALLDHIDYAVKKFGVEHVAIGTDVAHTSQYSSAENAKVPKRAPRRNRFASLWPDGALGGNWPRQESLAWTNWPLFTVGLVQRGYSDDEIRKILGENVLRVCRDVLVDSQIS